VCPLLALEGWLATVVLEVDRAPLDFQAGMVVVAVSEGLLEAMEQAPLGSQVRMEVMELGPGLQAILRKRPFYCTGRVEADSLDLVSSYLWVATATLGYITTPGSTPSLPMGTF